MCSYNVAGWTQSAGFNTAVFESGQITLRGDNGGRAGISTSKSYNLSPYTYVHVQVRDVYVYNTYMTPSVNICRGQSFYSGGSIYNSISKINLTSSATYNQTFSFNISAHKITDYLTFCIFAYVTNHSGSCRGIVDRIWLA